MVWPCLYLVWRSLLKNCESFPSCKLWQSRFFVKAYTRSSLSFVPILILIIKHGCPTWSIIQWPWALHSVIIFLAVSSWPWAWEGSDQFSPGLIRFENCSVIPTKTKGIFFRWWVIKRTSSAPSIGGRERGGITSDKKESLCPFQQCDSVLPDPTPNFCIPVPDPRMPIVNKSC